MLGANLVSKEGREQIEVSDIPVVRRLYRDSDENFEIGYAYQMLEKSAVDFLSNEELEKFSKRLAIARQQGKIDDSKYMSMERQLDKNQMAMNHGKENKMNFRDAYSDLFGSGGSKAKKKKSL